MTKMCETYIYIYIIYIYTYEPYIDDQPSVVSLDPVCWAGIAFLSQLRLGSGATSEDVDALVILEGLKVAF